MQTKVQFIINLYEDINIYYVLDHFGRTWHTVASSPSKAKNNIEFGEDTLTYKLYTTEKFGESLPQYDFKNLILEMLEKMGLQDTYEYEEVVGWDNLECFKFMKRSSLHPCELLLEIQKSIMNFDHCAG